MSRFPPPPAPGETIARRLWPNDEPIGKRTYFRGPDSTTWRTVAGVAGDIHWRSLRESTPSVHLRWRQAYWRDTFAVRTSGELSAVLPALRPATRAVSPTVTRWKADSMDDLLAEPLAWPRLSALLLGAFAAVRVLRADWRPIAAVRGLGTAGERKSWNLAVPPGITTGALGAESPVSQSCSVGAMPRSRRHGAPRSSRDRSTPTGHRAIPGLSCRPMSDMPEHSANPIDRPAADAIGAASAATALDADEFQSLLIEVLPSAYAYAHRLTQNRADAEDLVQDAVLRAFRARDTFEPGTNFKAWIFRILTRCFWANHRRRQRRPNTVDFDDTPDLYLYARCAEHDLPWQGRDPAHELIDRLGAERVADAIAQLPEAYGVVCTLYFMEDFAYHEIADVLEVPVGTVRSRLHRGRKMLQKALWVVARESGIVTELSRQEDEA